MKKRICSILLTLALACGFAPAVGGQARAATFRDVRADAWYASYVEQAYDQGLMAGTDPGLFSPNQTLTRAMFVTVLGRMHAVDADAYKRTTTFTDAPGSSWYGPYVNWASANGIVSGYENRRFGANDSITREQMAAIIARYVEFLGVELPDADNPVASFRDKSKVSSWARDGLELMRRTGIISGDENRNFNPAAGALRAEAATIFVRLMDALDGAAEEEPDVDLQADLENVCDAFEDAELERYAEGYNDAASDSERTRYAEEIFDYFSDLEQEGVVQSVSWNKTDNVIDFKSATGVLCMYELDEGGRHFGASPAANTSPVYAASTTQDENGLYLSGGKAVILSSFPKTSTEYNQQYLDLIGTLENTDTRTGFNVTYYDSATVPNFKMLQGASVIAVNTHGNLSHGYPVISLEEKVTDAKNKSYQSELNKGYVGIYGNNWASKGKYMIFPSFFTGTYGSGGLNGSLIHLCCCEGMANSKLASALLAAGAETVSGYTASVTTTYDKTCAETYFGSLMDGKSVAVAVTDVLAAVNNKADTYEGAAFKVEGSRAVYLVGGNQLQGTVFNSQSVGIAGATVTLKSGGQTVATGTTAADGSYSLPCKWDKTSYTLSVSASGFQTKEETLYTRVARHDVTLTAGATAKMQITLKSADNKNLGVYGIVVRDKNGNNVWEVTYGLGTFVSAPTVTCTSVALPANANYTVTAKATDYAETTVTTQLGEKDLALTVELYRGAYGCAGKVVDSATGAALSGIKAELVTNSGTVGGSATTDRNGAFTVQASAGLAHYNLRLSGSGYETYTDDSLLFALNDTTDVGTIRLVKTGASGGETDPSTGGDGNETSSQPATDGEYTLLYTESDLAAISGKPGKYKLANDITATNYGKTIGGLVKELHEDAVLDGDGHTIRVNVTQQYESGVIEVNNGVVRNLHVTGTATFEEDSTTVFGGVVCYNYGLIENCSFDGTIRAPSGGTSAQETAAVGGVCGFSRGGTIRDCTMSGSINLTMEGSMWAIGGVCGYLDGGAQLENCINHADISVTVNGGSGGSYKRAHVGGVFGYSNGLDGCDVDHCLNTASIRADTGSGITYAGGVGGWSGMTSDCGNTGASIYAGYGSDKPSNMDSEAAALCTSGDLGYTTSSTVLYDSENGKRNPTESAHCKFRSASEIRAMW